MDWKDGRVTQFRLSSPVAQSVRVAANGTEKTYELTPETPVKRQLRAPGRFNPVSLHAVTVVFQQVQPCFCCKALILVAESGARNEFLTFPQTDIKISKMEDAPLNADFINLTADNLASEHLCCIIRSRVPHPGVEAKAAMAFQPDQGKATSLESRG